MAELKADVLVLGAGMVGVSAALHLQKRGRDVILVDQAWKLAGEETSFGNAGHDRMRLRLPLHVPPRLRRDPALCAEPLAAGALSASPICRPFCHGWSRYYLASSPQRALQSAMAELPLIRRSLIEHEALIAEAGVPELLRRTGWIKLFRSDATLAKARERFRTGQAVWRHRRDSRRCRRSAARAAA